MPINESDITDELAKGGPALGSFLKSVGLAVAESQAELDKNLAETAKKLSETQIDVIAVFEQEIGNDGLMKEGKVHMQKLPLINYLMPTAYQYTRVYLEANMQVSEFSGEKGLHVKAKAKSFGVSVSGSYGLTGGRISGGMSYGSSKSSVDVNRTTDTDAAAGDLHMESTLEPRGDIELPRPFIIQKGPRLKVQILSKTDISGTTPSGGGTAPVVGRKVSIKAILTDNNGAALTGKALQVSVDNPNVNYTTPSASGLTTDATTGEVLLDLEYQWGELPDGEAAPQPIQTSLRVWFGLVTETIAVSI